MPASEMNAGADVRWLDEVLVGRLPDLHDDEGTMDGFLVDTFASFYQEVARLKQMIVEGQSATVLKGALPSQPGPADLAAVMSGKLVQKLQRQAAELADAPEEARRAFAIARYVSAVLADEIFLLELAWPGQAPWLGCLVEQALFRRQYGGDMFYRLLDRLLQSRSRGRLHMELAAVFLLALQLGFKGELRGEAGRQPHALERYRAELHRFIAERRPPSQPNEPAFPQAYAYTLRDDVAPESERRLSPLRRWVRLGAAGVVLYLVVSTVLWWFLLAPLDQFVQRQLAASGG